MNNTEKELLRKIQHLQLKVRKLQRKLAAQKIFDNMQLQLMSKMISYMSNLKRDLDDVVTVVAYSESRQYDCNDENCNTCMEMGNLNNGNET